MDVLGAPRRVRSKPVLRLDSFFRQHALIDTEALHELQEELLQARRIVLLLGDGCGKAIDKIIEFAELVNAPIITGPSGKRWVNHQHPLYRGVLGYASHRSAQSTLLDERNDLVLAVGTRFSEMIFSGWENNEDLGVKLIHIDENLENLSNSPFARLQVYGTICCVFQALIDRLQEQKNDGAYYLPLKPVAVVQRTANTLADFPHSQIVLNDPAAFFSNATPLKPQRLMRELSVRMPRDARVFVDAGNSWAWATHYLHMRSSGLYRVGMGFGAMAWAIGASVGSALGSPQSPTFCITGDGSFLMSGQELTVAVAEKLPVVFVILNDSVLGMVMHGQRLGGAEQVAFELPTIDFAQVARAMGAAAETIRTVKDLTKLDFNEICRRQGPTLLDVYIDPEEVPPMGARMKTLGRAE
jgi:acetolactate synthase-1/2/3 large subunit